ncbi:alpha/beta hydrolase [Candidatus Saccharibacteria bacterium]|nr:alpha/beta hydrolase [Candidatus Saccharibacteria bacterium]
MWHKKLVLKKTHDVCAVKTPKLTVVFIHGVASDSSVYCDVLRYLEGITSLREIRFVTFDLLGAGVSIKDDQLNYDYKEQTEALHNAILRLKTRAPLVLVGHSLGSLIAMKYAGIYKKTVQQLILVSPPIYTPEDLEDKAFSLGIKAFKKALSFKNPKILKEKAFNSSMDKIVLNKNNYKTAAGLKTGTVLIYGEADQFINPRNLLKLSRDNPRYISGLKTFGRHGMSRDKYNKIREILEETLNA